MCNTRDLPKDTLSSIRTAANLEKACEDISLVMTILEVPGELVTDKARRGAQAALQRVLDTVETSASYLEKTTSA